MQIGKKYEIATKIWYDDLILQSKIMTLTKIFDLGKDINGNILKYYSFDENDYIQYPIKRIIREIENE